MKLSAGFYIGLTTAVLLALAVMGYYQVPFIYMLCTTVVGQVLLIIMVYKILTDDYHTTKTFEDWYEDQPLKKQ